MVQGVKSRCSLCSRLHRDCKGYPCSECIKRDRGDTCDPADLEDRLLKLQQMSQAPAMAPPTMPFADSEMTEDAVTPGVSTSQSLQEHNDYNELLGQEIDVADIEMADVLPLAPEIPGVPYSFAGSSLTQCMELTAGGHPCGMTCTYTCEVQDPPIHPTFHVCHVCRYQPDCYSLMDEVNMLEKNRLYLCHECTEERSRGPIVQLWEHPRRNKGETRERKDVFCKCNDRLTNGWVCKRHRILAFKDIEIWGREKVKSFRNFNQGDFCAACRTRKPKTQGEQGILMWNCAACEDLVIDRTFEITEEPNIEG